MITTHDVRMPIREWTLPELIRLNKLTSNLASDWEKASLKALKDVLRLELLEFQKYSCAYCKREITAEIGRSELDHIIPCSIAPRFTFVRANLTLTCKRCNHSKRDHNPTVLSDDELGTTSNYVCEDEKYMWIHPFLHNYDEHINIINGSVFEARNDSKNGLSVINKCKLDEMSQVVDIQKTAKVVSSRNPMQAIFKMLGEYPEEPADKLANRLHRNFSNIPRETFLERIEKLRSDNPMAAFDSFW